MSSVTAIKNYILFLKKEHLFSISLHPAVFDPIINSSELRVFNIHTSPYCTLIKTNKAAQEKCICMQKRVFEKCKNGSYC